MSDSLTRADGETTASARAHTVVGNSALLVGARVGSLAVTTVVTIYAVRHVSASAWGHYATALALVAVCSVISDSGIATFALREFSSRPAVAQSTLAAALTALAATSAVAIAVLLVVAGFADVSHAVAVLVLIACPLVALQPLLSIVYAAFNARQMLAPVATTQVVQAMLYGSLGIILVAGGASVRGLAGATVAAAFIAAGLAFALMRRRLGLTFALTGNATAARRCIWSAVPLAGIGVVGIVYDRLDVLLLSGLADARAVAYYNVAYSIVTLSSFAASIVAATFFPLLNATMRHDRERARDLFLLVVRLFFLLAVPIAVVLSVAGEPLITFVFGDRYHGAGAVLAIMAWTVVVGFQTYVFWYAILAIHRERQVLAIQVAGLAINGVLNVVLIPPYGPKGAAAALLVSDFVIFVSQVPIVHRNAFRLPFRRLLIPPIAGIAGAAAVVVPLAQANAIAAAAAGVAAYGMIVVLPGYITRDEWASIMQPLRNLVTRPARAM